VTNGLKNEHRTGGASVSNHASRQSVEAQMYAVGGATNGAIKCNGQFQLHSDRPCRQSLLVSPIIVVANGPFSPPLGWECENTMRCSQGDTMEIVRNADGSLVVPIPEVRHHDEEGAEAATDVGVEEPLATTRVLHPGEGGYNEALAEWDLQQNPDREPAVSTASGRENAMEVVHVVAESPDHDVAKALKDIDDSEASGEALRHVLIGGTHSVEAFSAEVAEAEGGEPIPAHKMTKIIGEVLAELDK
jgi:hypothetical protein